jgi:hypothetical protein
MQRAVGPPPQGAMKSVLLGHGQLTEHLCHLVLGRRLRVRVVQARRGGGGIQIDG